MSKLMSYANREYDASHDVAFFDVCGLDMDDLFGVSPENQDPKGNVEGEHRARIEAHDRYYSELRDDLLDRREKGHSSYKEVIREHNHLVNSSRNRGNIVFGNARRAISWGSDLVGISTIVDAPSLPEEMRKTIAAGYVGTKAAALLGNIVAYSGQRKANRYQLPAPDFAKEINLGKMDYWQLEYNRDRYRDRVLQFLTGASD